MHIVVWKPLIRYRYWGPNNNIFWNEKSPTNQTMASNRIISPKFGKAYKQNKTSSYQLYSKAFHHTGHTKNAANTKGKCPVISDHTCRFCANKVLSLQSKSTLWYRTCLLNANEDKWHDNWRTLPDLRADIRHYAR